MNLIIYLYHILLYQPLYNSLVLLYHYLPGHDFGLSIIVLTLLVRVILYPLMHSSLKSQKAMSALQPKLQEIQRKHKGDLAKQSQAIMELYRKEKINPASGFLSLLIQLPLLIALYQVFWKFSTPGQVVYLYSFVPNPGEIEPMFLNFLNLAKPSALLAVLAGIFQFFQTKMITPPVKKGGSKDSMSRFTQVFQKEMLYFFPIFTVLILWRLPSAIGLFWITTTLFSIGQQYMVYGKGNSNS